MSNYTFEEACKILDTEKKERDSENFERFKKIFKKTDFEDFPSWFDDLFFTRYLQACRLANYNKQYAEVFMHFPNYVYKNVFDNYIFEETKENIKKLILENLQKNGFLNLTVEFWEYTEKIGDSLRVYELRSEIFVGLMIRHENFLCNRK